MGVITLRLEHVDVMQLLDGLEVRAASWEDTARYFAEGSAYEGGPIEECSDSAEAIAIAAHYREIIASIERQLDGQA